MTDEKRNEIILSEIEIAKKALVQDPYFCGFGANSDIFKLSDGREAQITINITVDEDEFEDPTNSFLNATQLTNNLN